ncbi:MAG: hypothetical protein MUF69_12600, partial [Desulfobacterota bacterium]|nr:hypothetical protein [Thermodesulfobacteriota bacterium]
MGTLLFAGAGLALWGCDRSDSGWANDVRYDAHEVKYILSCDQVGSLRLVMDAAGNVVKRIDYDTFGYVVNDTNPLMTMP